MFFYYYYNKNILLWTNTPFFCDHLKIDSDRHRTFIDFDRSKISREHSKKVEKGRERTTKVDSSQFFDFFGCLNNTTFEIKSFWLNLQIFIQIFWTVFDSFRPCSTVFEHSRTFRIDHNGRIGRYPSSNDHKRKVCLSKVVH